MDHLDGRLFLDHLSLQNRMKVLAHMQSMKADILARRETKDAELARIHGWPVRR
jgi:hypothetical protein